MAGNEESEAGAKVQLHYHVSLDAAQLKILYTALTLLRDDLGHEEQDIGHVVQELLDKLPGEHDMRAIDLSRELRRRSEERR